MLTAAFHMLKTGAPYRDLGVDHFSCHAKAARTRRLIKQLVGLGYDVKPAKTARA